MTTTTKMRPKEIQQLESFSFDRIVQRLISKINSMEVSDA